MMKITGVRGVAINRPLETPFKGGTYQHDRRGTIITTITTDEGIIGQAYVGQNRTKIPEQQIMCDIINNKLKVELLDEDPFMIEHLYKKMYKHTIPRKNQILVWESIACVDVTLYDLVGKALGIPVFKLLGGSRDKVPLISVQYYREREDFSEQLEELRRATSLAKKSGFFGIKLKVGALSIEQEFERVKAVREEGGENFLICCDANLAWTPEQAIKFGKMVEDLSIAYLEEPVQWYDEKRGLRNVREALNIPISACQGVSTRSQCLEYIRNGCVDMINHDVSRIGGITEWIKIAHIAEYYDVKITAHANIETTLHLFGASPNATWATQQTPNRDPFWSGGELVKSPPKPVGGLVKLPNRPGLGYEINEKAIEKYIVS